MERSIAIKAVLSVLGAMLCAMTLACADTLAYFTATDAVTRSFEVGDVTPAEPEAFGVFSADDGSLTLYKRTDMPVAGETYQGKAATKVYPGIEACDWPPWFSVRKSVLSVVIADEIRPTYLAAYFKDFVNCTSIENLSNLDTSASGNLYGMFDGCKKLTRIDASYLVRENTTSIGSLFKGCESLSEIGGMDTWVTVSVTSSSYAFYMCEAVTVLDQSSWSTPSLTNTSHMYHACLNLEKVYVGPGWCKDYVTNSNNMFGTINTYGVAFAPTKLVGGNGTAYQAAYILADYNYGLDLAQADLPGQPGFFTLKI